MSDPTEDTVPIETVQALVLPTMPGVVVDVVIVIEVIDGETVETVERFVRLDRDGPDVWLSLDDQLVYELHAYHSWTLVALPLRLMPLAVHDFLAREGFDPKELAPIVGLVEAAAQAHGARRS